MQYLVLHTADPDSPGTWGDEHWAALTSWLDESISAGVNWAGDPLGSAADATTVKVRDGQLIVTDGPFAETKEQIAGFDVLDCADLDEAIQVAARHPMARAGLLEVRPFRALGDD
jgi:hypothetical protein